MKTFQSNYRDYKFIVCFIKKDGNQGSNSSTVSAQSITDAENMIYDEYRTSELIDDNPVRLFSINKAQVRI